MKVINIHDAKTQLSRLIERALAGEKIVIAKAGEPLIQLMPFKNKRVRRTPGTLKGHAKIHKEFFEPLDRDFMKFFS
jgi:prevent-host-death family protein